MQTYAESVSWLDQLVQAAAVIGLAGTIGVTALLIGLAVWPAAPRKDRPE